ncbi:VOC family protein [Jatrophihabitans fulvus]
MASAISSLVIDAVDPDTVARFWSDVLGWPERERDDSDGLVIVIGPDGGGPGIDVVRVPEDKTVKNRLHLDLRADGTTTADELYRLLALGARRVDVGQSRDASWVVLADPEGNEFCLLSRTMQEIPD